MRSQEEFFMIFMMIASMIIGVVQCSDCLNK
jgi:hypothetical protein